ncbi:hypothetical protein N9301_00930 [Paracoccaceae bacterium]|nr:hypothetical protein [Paracoccaceae bacterium]
MDKLLETFAVISNNLKSPNLHNQISSDKDFGKKVEELETLVEELKVQQAQNSFSDETLPKALHDLSSKLSEISEHCDQNLEKLDFLRNIKPIS